MFCLSDAMQPIVVFTTYFVLFCLFAAPKTVSRNLYCKFMSINRLLLNTNMKKLRRKNVSFSECFILPKVLNEVSTIL